MSLDNKKPIGLKITKAIVSNVFWYLVFSFIYLDLNPETWWVIKNSWGRLILILLELSIIHNIFNSKK